MSKTSFEVAGEAVPSAKSFSSSDYQGLDQLGMLLVFLDEFLEPIVAALIGVHLGGVPLEFFQTLLDQKPVVDVSHPLTIVPALDLGGNLGQLLVGVRGAIEQEIEPLFGGVGYLSHLKSLAFRTASMLLAWWPLTLPSAKATGFSVHRAVLPLGRLTGSPRAFSVSVCPAATSLSPSASMFLLALRSLSW